MSLKSRIGCKILQRYVSSLMKIKAISKMDIWLFTFLKVALIPYKHSDFTGKIHLSDFFFWIDKKLSFLKAQADLHQTADSVFTKHENSKARDGTERTSLSVWRIRRVYRAFHDFTRSNGVLSRVVFACSHQQCLVTLWQIFQYFCLIRKTPFHLFTQTTTAAQRPTGGEDGGRVGWGVSEREHIC